MKRLESRKSYSWWWDSHVGPKNSKWLTDNLEEMDQSVKRMLKLIEEDGDSFAKKAEMYYKRRPDLISHVEEFYRMYRSLAERYDHLTGELRRNMPSDLQSQGSGISDISLDPPPSSPCPDLKLVGRRSRQQAAAFESFIGFGGVTFDMLQKEGYESSSLTDSEPECDSASVNNYSGYLSSGTERGLQEKVFQLENELRVMKEKHRMELHESADGSCREDVHDTVEDLASNLANYERQLAAAVERARFFEGKIATLKTQLQKSGSDTFPHFSVNGHGLTQADVDNQEVQLNMTQGEASQFEEDNLEADDRSDYLMEQIKGLKEKLQDLETENYGLRKELQNNKSFEKSQLLVQEQVELAQKDVGVWKTKYNAERKEISKLNERLARLKTSLSDRDREIRELKIAVSDAEQKIFPEKHQIKAEMSKILEDRTMLEEQLREQESRGRLLEEEIRKLNGQITEMKEGFNQSINQLRSEIAESTEKYDNLSDSYSLFLSERNALHTEVSKLQEEILSKDEQIDERDKQLEQLRLQSIELRIASEGLQKLVQESRARARQLEEELDQQGLIILEGAEKKREAIRQLCFSLEHYRSHYYSLRQAVMRHKQYSRPHRVSQYA